MVPTEADGICVGGMCFPSLYNLWHNTLLKEKLSETWTSDLFRSLGATVALIHWKNQFLFKSHSLQNNTCCSSVHSILLAWIYVSEGEHKAALGLSSSS